MTDLNLYTNLLYRAGVITEKQAEEVARLMEKIDDHEHNRQKLLEDEFWETEFQEMKQ